MCLRADEAGVERASDGRVARAFENRAAIWENSHFVRIYTEAEQEIVAANFAGRCCKPPVQFREIKLAAALVNLNGVASTHGDVRLGRAFEIDEISANAGAAFRIAR